MGTNADGELTPEGFTILAAYARMWLTALTRDLTAERAHPELSAYFYDVRSGMAQRYAGPQNTWPRAIRKSLLDTTKLIRAPVRFYILE